MAGKAERMLQPTEHSVSVEATSKQLLLFSVSADSHPLKQQQLQLPVSRSWCLFDAQMKVEKILVLILLFFPGFCSLILPTEVIFNRIARSELC